MILQSHERSTMNPVERVKSLLNSFVEPLCRDGPFSSAGRKVEFDKTSEDVNRLSYQAFVNRIITFKPECWSSAPNAAVYLAKHGFLTVSGHLVRCCSCHLEVDLEAFLGKPEVLFTLAVKSHRESCRWLAVSAPEEYFEITRNPNKAIQDLKTAVTELVTFDARVPLIPKDIWFTMMGITEEFIRALLNYFQYPYDELKASCIVLSLCGWVKSTDTSMQCNFCQRVVGVWNFCSQDSRKANTSPLLQNKKKKVVSLLYSEIRRSMTMMEVDKDCEEKSGTLNDTASTADVNPPLESPQDNLPPVLVAEIVRASNVEESEDQTPNDDSSSLMDECTDTGSDSDAFQREFNFLHAQDVKKKALKCLWTKTKRGKERSVLKELRLKFSERAKRRRKYVEELQIRASESVIVENDTENIEMLSGHNPEIVSIVSSNSENEERMSENKEKSSNCDVSSGEVEFCEIKSNNTDDCKPRCESLPLNSGSQALVNDKCDNNEPKCNVQNASVKKNGSQDSSRTSGLRSKDNTNTSNVSENSKLCATKCENNVAMNVERSDSNEEPKDSNKVLNRSGHSEHTNTSEVTANESNRSCLNTKPTTDESLDVRRKRKLVPECEQNGTPHHRDTVPLRNIQINPAHCARNIKKIRKDRQLNINEQNMEASALGNGVDGVGVSGCEEIIRKRAADEGTLSNCGSAICKDINEENDSKNLESDRSNASNHEADPPVIPVVCAVVGNTVIPNDICENDKRNAETNKEITSCPVVDSSKSVSRVGELQTNVAEGESPANPIILDEQLSSENKHPVENNVDLTSKCTKDSSTNASEDNSKQERILKRKRVDCDEDLELCSKRKKLEEFEIEVPPSYFHPELEHRFWCIWRIQTADYLSQTKKKKGWEFYAEIISKALEIHNAQKGPVREVEVKALNCIAEIMGITRPWK